MSRRVQGVGPWAWRHAEALHRLKALHPRVRLDAWLRSAQLWTERAPTKKTQITGMCRRCEHPVAASLHNLLHGQNFSPCQCFDDARLHAYARQCFGDANATVLARVQTRATPKRVVRNQRKRRIKDLKRKLHKPETQKPLVWRRWLERLIVLEDLTSAQAQRARHAWHPYAPLASVAKEKQTPRQLRRSALLQSQGAKDDLYIFQNSAIHGQYKVGRSKNVENRRRRLQECHNFEIQVMATFPGQGDLEHKVHALLRAFRVRGPGVEWFQCPMVKICRAIERAASQRRASK